MNQAISLAEIRREERHQLRKILAGGMFCSLLIHTVVVIVGNYLPTPAANSIDAVEVTMIDASELPPESLPPSPTASPAVVKPTPITQPVRPSPLPVAKKTLTGAKPVPIAPPNKPLKPLKLANPRAQPSARLNTKAAVVTQPRLTDLQPNQKKTTAKKPNGNKPIAKNNKSQRSPVPLSPPDGLLRPIDSSDSSAFPPETNTKTANNPLIPPTAPPLATNSTPSWLSRSVSQSSLPERKSPTPTSPQAPNQISPKRSAAKVTAPSQQPKQDLATILTPDERDRLVPSSSSPVPSRTNQQQPATIKRRNPASNGGFDRLANNSPVPRNPLKDPVAGNGSSGSVSLPNSDRSTGQKFTQPNNGGVARGQSSAGNNNQINQNDSKVGTNSAGNVGNNEADRNGSNSAARANSAGNNRTDQGGSSRSATAQNAVSGLQCAPGANCEAPYPEAANGVQGTTRLQVVLNSDGRVSHTQVAKSSGSDLLDRAAVTATQEMRFVLPPGKDRKFTVDINFTSDASF